VYLDESPISVALFTPDLELFDLDRFEVLRARRARCSARDPKPARFATSRANRNSARRKS